MSIRILDATASITCPYCGKKNKVWVEGTNWRQLHIAFCDVEIGGCRQPFVYEFDVGISVRVGKIQPPVAA